MNYGLPYMGSKSRICDWLLQYLPDCDNFVDVFCGGCSVTHAMMLSNKAKNYILNDLNVGVAELFSEALSGFLVQDIPFVDKEDFLEIKSNNMLLSLCYSFGTARKNYVYNSSVEPYKKALHYAIVFNDFSYLSDFCSPSIINKAILYLSGVHSLKDRRSILCSLFKREGVKELSRVEHLERFERILSCKSNNLNLFSFSVYGVDYRSLDIPNNSVIYCDPPYENSRHDTYVDAWHFDHSSFKEWCIEKSKSNYVFVSSYNIDDNHFKVIATKTKTVFTTYNKTDIKSQSKEERLYMVEYV